MDLDLLTQKVADQRTMIVALEKSAKEQNEDMAKMLDMLKQTSQVVDVIKVLVTRLIINPDSLKQIISDDGDSLDVTMLGQIDKDELISHPTFREGAIANQDGRSLTDCPYEAQSRNAERWSAGHKSI